MIPSRTLKGSHNSEGLPRSIGHDSPCNRLECYYRIIPMKTEPVTTLKRHATRILAELSKSKDPVLITEHGKPSAYLVDVDVYEHMRDRMRILEGIARGERAILERRTFTHAEAKRKMKKWLG